MAVCRRACKAWNSSAPIPLSIALWATKRSPRACRVKRYSAPARKSMSAGVPTRRMSSMPQADDAATTCLLSPSAISKAPFKSASLRETKMRHAKMQWLGPILGRLMMALTSGVMTCPAMAKDIELSFYYPIAVGGPIPKIIDGYVADFEKENPGITIKAIYAGTYQDTLVKALTAFKSGEPPDIAVLLSTDMFTLIDEDAIAPFDDL